MYAEAYRPVSGTPETHRPDASVTSGVPDLSEFSALAQRQGAKCDYRHMLAVLSETERAAYDAALHDRSYQVTAIVRWLDRRGIIASKSTVQRHRLNECVTCRT